MQVTRLSGVGGFLRNGWPVFRRPVIPRGVLPRGAYCQWCGIVCMLIEKCQNISLAASLRRIYLGCGGHEKLGGRSEQRNGLLCRTLHRGQSWLRLSRSLASCRHGFPCPYGKGRSIYYVRTEGVRGVREVANYANDKTDRLRENANKGGRGSKIPKILRT